MAEPEAAKPTADSGAYYVDENTGFSYKATPKQVADLPSTTQWISKEAYSNNLADEEAGKWIDGHISAPEQAVVSAADMLTLGALPALIGGGDPTFARRVDLAKQKFPLATAAGNAAGLILPAMVTGGASAGARGLAAMTPAGLMMEGGAAIERAALRALPESAGLLGRTGRAAIGMGLRGGVEGTIVGTSQYVSDSLIHDRKMTAEALAASARDGALFGTLLGAGTGGLIHAGGEAAEMAARQLGKSSKIQNAIISRLGKNAEEFTSTADKDAWLKTVKEGLKKEGAGLGSPIDEISAVSKRVVADQETIIKSSLKDLDYEAHSLAPKTSVLRETLARGVNPELANTIDGIKQIRSMDKAITKFSDILENSRNPWTKWNAQIEELMTKSDPASKQLQLAMSSTMKSALDAAEARGGALEGISEKFSAAKAASATFKDLQDIRPKVASSPLGTGNYGLGAAVAFGHPIQGLIYAGAKRAANMALDRIGPAALEKAYGVYSAGKAALATDSVKRSITDGVKAFFNTAVRQKTAGHVAGEVRKQRVTRESYDDTYERVSKALGTQHKEAIMAAASRATAGNDQRMVDEIMNVNGRAADMLTKAMPPANGMSNLMSMKKQPKAASLSPAEHRFLNITNAVTNPMGVISDLVTGKINGDSVEAIKSVYPALYGHMVDSVYTAISDMKASGKTLPYNKVIQLGLLLDAPIDSTLSTEYIRAVQATFTKSQPAQPSPSPEAGTPEGYATKSETVERQ